LESSQAVLVSLRRITRAVDLHSRRLEREVGLTGPQAVALQTIGERGSLTAGDLARHVHLSQATLTPMLDRLESKGLVTRSRSQSDRRKVFVTLTASGQERVAQAPALLETRFQARYRALPDWEQSLILSALQRVATMMDEPGLGEAALLANAPDASASERQG